MPEPTPFTIALNHYLSLATLIAIVVLVIITIHFLYCFFNKKSSWFFDTLSEWVLVKGFFIALFGTLLSLYYSYGLLYTPCELCWFQRIFLYPQLFIFGLAWWKKDRTILPYSLLLSIVGFLIAIYHHMLQIGYNLYKPCSAIPFSADCAKPLFVEYGFVTFPLMAGVLFGFLIIMTAGTLYIKKRG
jgi:disulfide bond formation protein DsbB